MRQKFGLSLTIFFISVFSFAQNNVSFEAYCDAKKVVLGNYFEVEFTLKNANGQNFKAPSFKGFDVLSGPNSSVSTQIINGVVSRQSGYSYTLMPQKLGKFQIGSAYVLVNGKTLKTSPLQIEVVKGRAGGGSTHTGADAEVFIRAEANTTEAAIGQQVLVDYKLYTTVNIDSYSPMEESEYSGFFAQDVKRFNSQVMREVADGVQYTTKILKRVALFPQQAGILTVEPMKMRLEVVTGRARDFGFFSRNTTKPVVARTEPLEINVRQLPENPPFSFNGAVGQYAFQATVKNPVLSTDEALKIEMLINGNGDIKRLQAPDLALHKDSFEVYEAKVLDEKMFENQGEINGRKMFEVIALPKYPGRYDIQPEFTYFDTDSLKYVTLKDSPVRIAVRKGTGIAPSALSTPTETAVFEDIRFIKTQTEFEKIGSPFFGSTPFWILTILPFLLLGGVFTYKRILDKQNNLDADFLKQRRADKVALNRLKTSKKHLDSGESRSFYDEISRASLGYVCDKLSIPLSELTKVNVREKLESLSVSSENIERFMTIIKTCETALFAGMDNSAAMKETYESAIGVISGIEEEIGR